MSKKKNNLYIDPIFYPTNLKSWLRRTRLHFYGDFTPDICPPYKSFSYSLFLVECPHDGEGALYRYLGLPPIRHVSYFDNEMNPKMG